MKTFSMEMAIRTATNRYRADNALPPACEICGRYSCVCNDEVVERVRMSQRDENVLLDNHSRMEDFK